MYQYRPEASMSYLVPVDYHKYHTVPSTKMRDLAHLRSYLKPSFAGRPRYKYWYLYAYLARSAVVSLARMISNRSVISFAICQKLKLTPSARRSTSPLSFINLTCDRKHTTRQTHNSHFISQQSEAPLVSTSPLTNCSQLWCGK